MEPSFWLECWRKGRTAFHEGKPNAFLARHVARLGAPGRVLVPLCGKTEDMAFLRAQGHEVVGVELAESALEDFFREHGITPEVSRTERFTTLRAEGITLLAGDFFDLSRDHAPGITAVYDRAALVALPHEMRARYAEHIRALAPAGAPMLVVTFDYPQTAMDGPPFAVPEADLRALYADATVLELDHAPMEMAKLREAGVSATERCWLVTL